MYFLSKDNGCAAILLIDYNEFLEEKKELQGILVWRILMSEITYDYMEEYIRGLIPDRIGHFERI